MSFVLGSDSSIVTSDVDPFSHEFLEDPTPFHADLREAGPVVYLRKYDTFALARYEQVHAALVNWQEFESGSGVGLANFRDQKAWRHVILIEADPPRHDAPRRVLSKVLNPRSLRRLRDRWMSDAEELVDSVLARGTEFNAVSELAEAFPLRVFPDAVGIPQEGRENLLPYGDCVFNSFGPENDLVATGAPRVEALTAWVVAQCGREVLDGNGFGEQIWAASDRGEILPQMAPLLVRSLLTAGVDTTVHGLSAALYAFATNPAQWDRLRSQPSLSRVAFDEAVRWESPVQTFFRTATRDVVMGEYVIPEGRKILMFLGAANRDPSRWHDPHSFDLSRDPSGHVGFGMGIHQCVGQHVARLEAEALLTALAQRVRSIELMSPPVRHHNNTLRAWESIPIRVRVE